VKVSAYRGEIRQIDDGICSVILDSPKDAWVYIHERQCRRLVKKKRREWQGEWLKVELAGGSGRATVFVPDVVAPDVVGESMTIREVPRGKDKS
jgi:hypothetical protein